MLDVKIAFGYGHSLESCSGAAQCIATGKSYFWQGSKIIPDLPLTVDQETYFGGISVNHGSPCFYRINGKKKSIFIILNAALSMPFHRLQ